MTGTQIYKAVIDAMQDAEEIHGPQGHDYIDLMVAIEEEAQRRSAEWESEQTLDIQLQHRDGSAVDGDVGLEPRWPYVGRTPAGMLALLRPFLNRYQPAAAHHCALCGNEG